MSTSVTKTVSRRMSTTRH